MLANRCVRFWDVLKARAMDFAPFVICEPPQRAPKPRRMDSPEGLGDRMRSAAFAELQARRAFAWASQRFVDVDAALRTAWLTQVVDEQRHYALIVSRMSELGFSLESRPVSTALWHSLKACTSGEEFCIKIVSAEERGRQAALALAAFLAERDPVSSSVFATIAREEVAHVELARIFYAWDASSAAKQQ